MTIAVENIPLWYNKASLKKQAQNLCECFQLDFADKSHNEWRLVLDELGLSLQHPNNKQTLSIHFDQGKNDHRRKFSNGRQQPLSKAVGLDKPRQLHILDATAGFGRDAFVFASLGAQVTMLERHPAMAALLYDGLERARLNIELEPILAKMTLVHGSSLDYLKALSIDNQPDVIYMDPMYPDRKKSALVKKDMQAAHAIVGADQDSEALLEVAIQTAKKRVVVKRPKNAEPIADKAPSTTVQSKNTRYDIYTKAKLD